MQELLLIMACSILDDTLFTVTGQNIHFCLICRLFHISIFSKLIQKRWMDGWMDGWMEMSK